MRSAREILNLPVGCEVTFDARVVEIFLRQILDTHNATRQNIAKILIYQYQRLYTRLGRRPTKRDVDRNCLLDTRLYRLVWRSWEHFMHVVKQDGYLVRYRVGDL
jgi:hypothetical protein